MREALAERLLAQVMSWTAEDVARERPLLQAMAALKYDEYQQYVPGMRFVESLALWLSQFRTEKEKLSAYAFITSRLVFFSSDEIAHLVSIAYPDYIRPLLIRTAADSLGTTDRYVSRIAGSKEYRVLRRQCLFLGLSDGARIDTFRRASTTELSHEQIWQTYEMSSDKASNMLAKLRKDPDIDDDAKKAVFRMIFLLDDFSGSGRSCLRTEGNALEGKVARFWHQITGPSTAMSQLVNLEDLYVGLVLYVATSGARQHLIPLLKELSKDHPRVTFGVHIVHLLDESVRLDDVRDGAFLRVADVYYDPSAEDEHTRKGGTDVKKGFGACALPLVLYHNTPNNSMFLLWANPEDGITVRGLFPRVSRHRSEH
jgi:hypothetical protein